MNFSFDPNNTLAILVGTSEYENFNNVGPILNNLQDFKSLLLDKKIIGFENESHVKLIENIDNNRSLRALKDTINDEKFINCKTIIIYYSGHGYRKRAKKELYLASKNSDKEISTSFIHFSELKDEIANSQFQNRILIIDSCHSGLAALDIEGASLTDEEMTILDDDDSNKGFYVLTSCSGNELSFFDSDDRNTYFTGEFLNLLKQGVLNSKPFLDLDTIYKGLNSRMRKRKLPEPNRKSTFTNVIFNFCKNVKYTSVPPKQKEELTSNYNQKLQWELVLKENSRLGFKAYIKRFPNSPYKKEAEKNLRYFDSKSQKITDEEFKENMRLLFSQCKADEKKIQNRFHNTLAIYIGDSFSMISLFEGNSWVDGSPIVIPNNEGKRKTPNNIAIIDDGEYRCGDPALRQMVTNPKNSIESILKYVNMVETPTKTSETLVDYFKKENQLFFKLHDKEYTVYELFSKFLERLITNANDYLGAKKITNLMISTPYNIDFNLKETIDKSAKLINLNVLGVIDETQATFLGYREKIAQKNITALYLSFEYESLTISLFEHYAGASEITANIKIYELGLKKIDDIIIDWLISGFENENTDTLSIYESDYIEKVVVKYLEEIKDNNKNKDSELRKNPMAIKRLEESVKKAREELTGKVKTTEINIPYITSSASGPKHLVKRLSLEKYLSLTKKMFVSIKSHCTKVLAAENLEMHHVDTIFLGGYATSIPNLKKEFSETFDNTILADDEVFEITATGIINYSRLYFYKEYGKRIIDCLNQILINNARGINEELNFIINKHIKNLENNINQDPWKIPYDIHKFNQLMNALIYP